MLGLILSSHLMRAVRSQIFLIMVLAKTLDCQYFRNLISKTVPEAASLHECVRYTVGNKTLHRKVSQMGTK